MEWFELKQVFDAVYAFMEPGHHEEAISHLVTGSDYPVLQDYESYTETFAYIERLGLPKADTDKILHHNAQKLFGFAH